MAHFVTTLQAEKAGKGTWIITRPLIYVSDVACWTFVVPDGFVTDFASVPRLPLAFLLTGDAAHSAAVIHDYAYKTAIVDRQTADAVFKEAAIASGEPAWRATLMHWGVRMGGWIAWNNHREAAHG